MPCFKSIGGVCLVATLTACAQEPPQVPPAPPPPVIASGQCDDGAARFAVGKTADAQLAEEARTRASAQRVRMVRPGDMVTMEFDAMRLTLDVDASGRVVRVRCG
ncbi:MAG: hypothetical protein JWQ07_3240 [Ramlibacter sp.]|nr:hypothetical protein [Ramlibacter sp.]